MRCLRSSLWLILLLAACTPAAHPSGQAAVMAATRTPRATATQAPPVIPTMDITQVARLTEASIQLAEAQAEQARLSAESAALQYQLTASAATGTAWPPMATQTAILLAYVGQTQVKSTANAETAVASYPTQTLVAAEVAREIRTAPVREGLSLSALGGSLGLVFVLVGLVIWRKWQERVIAKNFILQQENELAIQKIEIAQKRTARSDTFVDHAEHHYHSISPPMPAGVTPEHIQKVAAWVVGHNYTWSDQIRDGAGVGLSHGLLCAYRDMYLMRAGVLVKAGQGYAVTPGVGREYFMRKANGQHSPSAPTDNPTHSENRHQEGGEAAGEVV